MAAGRVRIGAELQDAYDGSDLACGGKESWGRIPLRLSQELIFKKMREVIW